ncbi:MAG: ComF family protein [Bacteroidetes bacterium]|nr:MAG: ComF family protein [Bacteroidota bacterium]
MRLLSIFLRDFFHVIYPAYCSGCLSPLTPQEQTVCLKCITHLPKTGFHLLEENPVEKLFYGRINLYSGTAGYYFHKGDTIQKLLHQLKYKNRPEIGFLLGKEMSTDWKESDKFSTIDCIIPIPLHPKKQKIRGYNQAEKIAQGIARNLKVEINTTALVRNIFTETQTKKSHYERWQNVSSAFVLHNPETFQDRHVLIVDDVLTTGATMEAALRHFTSVKNIKISVAVVAMA